jgi:hypothetical protein
MRIIAILAGQSLYKFRNEADQELYQVALGHSDWKSLPRGCIVGLALIDEAGPYDATIHDNPFAFGPYLYHINDVVALEQTIPYKGNLGLLTLTEDVCTQIKSQESVHTKVAEWCQLYPEVWGHEQLCGISIRQPPAEAIMKGVKRYENRTRSMFPIVKKQKKEKKEKKEKK